MNLEFNITLVLISVLRIYMLVLWGRLILEWVRAFNPLMRPKKPLLILFEIIYTLTDPPLKLARRIIPPITIGQVRLDVGLMAVMFLCWVLIQVLRYIHFSAL